MLKLETIKRNLYQIYAIVQKNLKLKFRFKIPIIVSFIYPLISLIIPIIILGEFFEYNLSFGVWNKDNFLIYQLTAYNITLIIGIMNAFPSQLKIEKFWQTLPILIIGPFNRFILLFGIIISEIILISLPFSIILILCYLYYPISLITLFFIICLYLLIVFIFF